MSDRSEFAGRLRARIKSSELWGPRSRETKRHLQGLKCPVCGRWDASAYTEFPWLIMCSHTNSCGTWTKTIDLFPELRENVERDFAPTREDPQRPAREYLYSRGLTWKTLEGLRYEYWPNIRKCGSGGVMFYVGQNAAGQDVWNGRIFRPPKGEGKTHNKGDTGGMIWLHPGRVYAPDKPTVITEAIIEALSLWEMDVQASAVLSAKQNPPEVPVEWTKKLVIGLNPDDAGREGLKKWKAKYPGAGAMIPLRGDWNDYLLSHGPGKAAEAFERDRAEMECRGKLFLAEKANVYADIWFEHYGHPPGLFEFDRRYYWGVFGKKDLDVRNVSDFRVETDHFQLDKGSPDNPVYRYFLKVRPANGAPVLCSMDGADLASPQAIRSALLSSARVMWKGDQGPSLALAQKIVGSGAPVVRQLEVIGYDRESGACVFHDFAIDREGKVHELGDKGFFTVGRKQLLRPPPGGKGEDRTLLPKKGTPPKRIYELIAEAWPDNGPLTVAFAVASWFVWAVKPELGFFPFLSLWGDTQTGKSELITRINAMQAIDSEGLPMAKTNTSKGELRDLAGKSGLVIGLLESRGKEQMRFDLGMLLTLFNAGNPLQVRAVKANNLATKVVKFLGTLCFVQNEEPFESKAQMERVVSSRKWLSKDINSATGLAFRELLKVPLREMAWCYVEVMARRREIEETWYSEYIRARDEILKQVPDNRIAETHGLVLGFHRIAEKIFCVKNDLTNFLVSLALRKHRKCNHREATEADAFFDSLASIDPKVGGTFMDLADGKLYINFNDAVKVLGGNGYGFFRQQLAEPLRQHPAFITNNWGRRSAWVFVRGFGDRTFTKRCWVFDETKLPEELCERLK
jgi:hypothetical protein